MTLNRIVCLVLGHRRSRNRARYDGHQWRSSCRRCRVAMKKHPDGRWRRTQKQTVAI